MVRIFLRRSSSWISCKSFPTWLSRIVAALCRNPWAVISLRDEGPFGDHTGYYTLPEPYPVFHVTAITHRKDAVYPAKSSAFRRSKTHIGGAALT